MYKRQGYTFRYFLEGLHQEQDVKILSVDGIKPTTENIKNQDVYKRQILAITPAITITTNILFI